MLCFHRFHVHEWSCKSSFSFVVYFCDLNNPNNSNQTQTCSCNEKTPHVKNATSSHKTTSLSGSWKHPHKYKRKVKAFIYQGLPCLLQAVTKISTVYKFYKGCSAANRHWQF